MAAMSQRQRIMAASDGGAPEGLPFFHYWRHCQLGSVERACRNRGMGMCWTRPGHVERLHDVEVVERQQTWSGQPAWRRTFTTPVGEVSTLEIRDAGVGQWHGQRSWRDVIWRQAHPSICGSPLPAFKVSPAPRGLRG
ncbi:MAG: hypothetical protein O2782_22895 [bacterium]|nr:hypothetical protein [bacterium]